MISTAMFSLMNCVADAFSRGCEVCGPIFIEISALDALVLVDDVNTPHSFCCHKRMTMVS